MFRHFILFFTFILSFNIPAKEADSEFNSIISVSGKDVNIVNTCIYNNLLSNKIDIVDNEKYFPNAFLYELKIQLNYFLIISYNDSRTIVNLYYQKSDVGEDYHPIYEIVKYCVHSTEK